MQGLQNASSYIVEVIVGFALYMVLLRFFMQLFRVDFRNDLGQFLISVTNPIVLPLRRIIPSIKTVDTSTLLLAYLVALLKVSLLLVLAAGPSVILTAFFNIAIYAVFQLIQASLYLFIAAIFISFIASWVAPHSYHPILMVARSLMEPLVAPVRRVIPPLGGIDFSPMVVLMGLNVIRILLGL